MSVCRKSRMVAIAAVLLLVFALALPSALAFAAGSELGIRGIGGGAPNQETGTYTFQALIGEDVTSNETSYVPIEGVTVRVYDDIDSRVVEDYENEIPIAEGVTVPPYVFDGSASLGVDKYRNFSIEIDGFIGRDRDVFFIASKEGYEPVGAQGYIKPVNAYTVTFDSRGGSPVAPASGLLLNGLVPKPADPTYAGYVFSGWYTDDSLEHEYDFTLPVTGDFTLYARWVPAPIMQVFTVTYLDGVEGEDVFADQVFADVAEGSATPSFSGTPERAGYVFTGWKPEVAAVVTGDAEYVAQWEKAAEPSVPGVTDEPKQPSVAAKAMPQTGDGVVGYVIAFVGVVAAVGVMVAAVRLLSLRRNR